MEDKQQILDTQREHKKKSAISNRPPQILKKEESIGYHGVTHLNLLCDLQKIILQQAGHSSLLDFNSAAHNGDDWTEVEMTQLSEDEIQFGCALTMEDVLFGLNETSRKKCKRMDSISHSQLSMQFLSSASKPENLVSYSYHAMEKEFTPYLFPHPSIAVEGVYRIAPSDIDTKSGDEQKQCILVETKPMR